MNKHAGFELGSRLMTSPDTERVDAPWSRMIDEITVEIDALSKSDD